MNENWSYNNSMDSYGGIKNTDPFSLLREGKNWLKLWGYANKDVSSLLQATYCLFSALELYLKAYIVLKDNSYANINKLRGLDHNFQKLYESIRKVDTKLAIQLNTQLKKYELRNFKLDALKYPENGKVWSLNHGLDKGGHTLDSLLKKIDTDITKNADNWFENKYPKKPKVSALVAVDYKDDPSKINLKKLSNTCSTCLPSGITILESYGFPWGDDRVPQRVCLKCKNWFDPNGMRRQEAFKTQK